MDVVTYALCRKYVADTAIALGAVKGAPCTITDIAEEADGSGSIITFKWTADDGVTTNTSTLKVKNGISIVGFNINADGTITLTMSDGTSITSADSFVGGTLKDELTATTAIGSVTSGKTYAAGTLLETIIRDILTTYQKAGLTVSLIPEEELYDIVSDTLSEITISAATTKGTNNIVSVTFFVDGIEVGETTTGVANGGTFNHDHSFANPQNQTFSVRVDVSDGRQITSQTKTVTFVPRSYYGTVSKDITFPTEQDVKGLEFNVLKNTQKLTWNNIDCQDAKLLYAYPKQFAALTSIIDSMNFPYLDSYTEMDIFVDGYEYRCYLLNIEMTCDAIEEFNQVFS